MSGARAVTIGNRAFVTGGVNKLRCTSRQMHAIAPRMTAAAETSTTITDPLVDLRGKKALVTGIANNRSIAWGITQRLHAAGAEIGVAFLPVNDKVEGKVR